MPTMNPLAAKWIPQLDDWDQASAFFAYQSLEQEVLHASGPEAGEAREELAKLLAGALTAAEPSTDSSKPPKLRHSARARRQMARLLGYIPTDSAVPQLSQALEDLDVREMARYALETNPSEAATEALLKALEAAGSEFRVGVVNSLARRGGAAVTVALRRAALDPQLEVRQAALLALADSPDAAHDAIIEKAARSQLAEERRVAHIARVRLASTLRANGKTAEAKRIFEAVLASDAGEAQKRAARIGGG